MKTKQALRTYYRQVRKALTNSMRTELSVAIAEQYIHCFEQEKPQAVHLFLPMESFKEVDTMLILQHLNTHFPKVKTLTSIIAEDDQSLLTVEVRIDTPLKENRWGILEPRQRLFFRETDIEEVLTPLLAIDKRGYRLGYGKGFYDRFFARCSSSVIKSGLNYNQPIEGEIPKDEWDVPLTRLIYPEGVYKFV